MKEILRNKSICYYKRPTITIYNLLSIHRFPTKDFFKNLIGENIPLIERTLTIDLSLVEPTETNLPATSDIWFSCSRAAWHCVGRANSFAPSINHTAPRCSASTSSSVGSFRVAKVRCSWLLRIKHLGVLFPQNDHLYSYVGVLPLPGFQWQMTFFEGIAYQKCNNPG